MSSARSAGAKLLLAVVVLAALAIGWPPGSAEADIDLTGTWNFSFVLLPTKDECPNVQVVQTGSDVTMADSPCLLLDGFVGLFDKATRAWTGFTCVPGDCTVFSGTVSPDGNSVVGIWIVSSFGIEFPFSATRKGTEPPTPTPTATPLPLPVGGVAFDPDLGALALEASEPSRYRTGVIVASTAAVAAFVVLAGAALYAKRRPAR